MKPEVGLGSQRVKQNAGSEGKLGLVAEGSVGEPVKGQAKGESAWVV